MGGLGEGLGFVVGGLLGLLLARIPSGRTRVIAWAASSVAFGALISWFNGELPTWPVFLAFDMLIVAGVSMSVALAARRVLGRRSPS